MSVVHHAPTRHQTLFDRPSAGEASDPSTVSHQAQHPHRLAVTVVRAGPADVDAVELPALLTIEEAARVLRVGRSIAYQLARRYFDGDGTEGLPVIQLGSCLRVPSWALQELIHTGSVVRLTDVSTLRVEPASCADLVVVDSRAGLTVMTAIAVAATREDRFRQVPAGGCVSCCA